MSKILDDILPGAGCFFNHLHILGFYGRSHCAVVFDTLCLAHPTDRERNELLQMGSLTQKFNCQTPLPSIFIILFHSVP
jgi:hypothetical protein